MDEQSAIVFVVMQSKACATEMLREKLASLDVSEAGLEMLEHLVLDELMKSDCDGYRGILKDAVQSDRADFEQLVHFTLRQMYAPAIERVCGALYGKLINGSSS